MNKERSVGIPLVNKKSKEKDWFSGLLNDVSLPTTYYIEKKAPNVTFKLLDQNVAGNTIIRKIGFFVGSRMICEATNKVEKNDLVKAWIKNNPDQPFGKVFQNKNVLRVLISKTHNSRKYGVTGDIRAEIEEKFYPLP